MTASGGGGTDVLPLTIRVADAAAGDVSLTADFAELKGPSSTTFTFNLTLHNDTSAEITFTMDAAGPAGWTVAAKPAGQAQATSTTVSRRQHRRDHRHRDAARGRDRGTYPIKVGVSGGTKVASTDLAVTITGTYTLSLSTPDQVLSTTANAGSVKDFALVVANSGSAPVTNVTMTASAPTNWKVEFDPATVASIPAGQTANVTAHITPTSDAIAGDYSMTITSKGTEASADTDIRVRVETPQFWWIVGVVLIVGVFAGLYWVFRKYGRR